MSNSNSGRSRFRVFERDVELELEPLASRDTIGLTVVFVSLCVVSCGGVLFYGGVSSHEYEAGWTGLSLIIGGGIAFGLACWLLQPHKAAKHASHRLRHHARKLRGNHAGKEPAMTDAQFDALEDELDRMPSHPPR